MTPTLRDETRQAWHDRHLFPFTAPATLAACVWTTTGPRGWPYLPVTALLVHTLAGLERGRAVLRPVPAVRRAHRARAGRAWLTLAVAVAAFTPRAWPFLPLAAVELAALVLATATLRARLSLRHRLVAEVADVCHVPAHTLRLTQLRWAGRRGRRCTAGRLTYPGPLGASVDAHRTALTAALRWHLAPPPTADVAFDHRPAERAVTWTTLPGLPTRVVDHPWPADLPGVVAGITTPEHASTVLPVRDADGEVHRVPLLCWDPTAHLLVAGITRSGKTQLLRGLVVRGLAAGAYPGGVWIIDGKGGGDFLALAGRQGVTAVANAPTEWRPALEQALTVMRGRYAQLARWQRGDAGRPDTPRALLVIDEVQQVAAEVGTALVEQVARLALAADVTMVVATQRPDTSSAIPGAARDNIADRIVVGPLSEQGARMMLPEHWRDALTTPRIPGRCLATLNGRLVRFQAPACPTPVDDPTAEPLWPPRLPPPVHLVDPVDPDPPTHLDTPAPQPQTTRARRRSTQ